MEKGALVPNKLILEMIKQAIMSRVDNSHGFLIDGYPRQIDQGIEFEKEVTLRVFWGVIFNLLFFLYRLYHVK
jgi:adenylate kinase family enzyme